MAEFLRVAEIVPISPNVVALIAQWLVGVETDLPVAADASAFQFDGLTARWLVRGFRRDIFPWFCTFTETIHIVSNIFAGDFMADL